MLLEGLTVVLVTIQTGALQAGKSADDITGILLGCGIDQFFGRVMCPVIMAFEVSHFTTHKCHDA